MKKEQKKILILSCGTGEGHNSAARALCDSLKSKHVPCKMLDVLTFKSEKTKNKVCSFYCAVIRRMPILFGMAYKMGEIYDNLKLPSPIYALNAKYADKLYTYIKNNAVTCVICTHLFAMEAMTAVRKRYGCNVECYGVMTDYTIHPFIKDTDLDGYFVPDMHVADQFLKRGFSEERIYCTGIPIHSKFNSDMSKQEAQKELGLPQNKKIVTIITGGAGCGKVKKLCVKLAKKLDDSHLIVALVGRNEKLKKRLDKAFAYSDKLITVPFTTDVHLYLKAADVVLSKSGGLSSTEIAALRVPLVHLKAIPGLETANLKYFARRGLSLRADTLYGAVKKTTELLDNQVETKRMRTRQRLNVKSHATEKITEKIMVGNKDDRFTVDNFYSDRVFVG